MSTRTNSILNYSLPHKPSRSVRSDAAMCIQGDCSYFEIELLFDRCKGVWFWTLKVSGFPFKPIVSTPFLERCNAVSDINDFVHQHLKIGRGKVYDI